MQTDKAACNGRQPVDGDGDADRTNSWEKVKVKMAWKSGSDRVEKSGGHP